MKEQIGFHQERLNDDHQSCPNDTLPCSRDGHKENFESPEAFTGGQLPGFWLCARCNGHSPCSILREDYPGQCPIDQRKDSAIKA